MDERDWYLLGSAGRRYGPYPRHVIDELHHRNELQPDTLLWHTGLARWQPAHRLLTFAQRAVEVSAPPMPRPAPSPPPGSKAVPPRVVAPKRVARPATKPATRPVARPPTPRPNPANAPDRNDPAVAFHPWQRALAAGVDLALVGLALSLLALGRAEIEFRPLVSGGTFVWVVAWAILDAALLVRFGTTPGRKLLGIAITDADGKALQPPRAAARSALLAFTVLGAGHFLFAPILSVLAFRFVAARGQGWWDIASGSRATFEDLPPWRRALGVALLIALLLAMLALRVDPATLPRSITL